MPEFAYTARSPQGQDSSGVISAGSRREAIALLADRSLFPLQVVAQGKEGARTLSFPWRHRVKSEVLADTFTQLSDLLSNGVPLLESLNVLVRQAVDPHLAEVLADVREQVADGTGIDTAMAKHRTVFSPLAISMVRAGLEGAFLEEALERIAAFLRKHEALRMKVIGSLTYPAILAFVGVGVTIFLVMFVVPMFQDFFDRLERTGSGLPLVTVILVAGSHFLIRYGLFAAGAWRCWWWRAAVGRHGRRTCRSRSLEVEDPRRRQDPPRHGRGPLLPRPGNAAAQRRADPHRAVHQQRIDRQPTAATGCPGIGRDDFVGRFALPTAGRLRTHPAARHGDDQCRRGSEHVGCCPGADRRPD